MIENITKSMIAPTYKKIPPKDNLTNNLMVGFVVCQYLKFVKSTGKQIKQPNKKLFSDKNWTYYVITARRSESMVFCVLGVSEISTLFISCGVSIFILVSVMNMVGGKV